ncbi:hypothetical protein PLICRDRAFT_39723 [Plicaturopsis crispa FD-325 SS-3]|nr:hypothetical protein PLICRDRAFT_39723 [Plicaturopsis crispa FD-325 SS-3]
MHSPVMESQTLPLDDYRRYGRQMILDGFGLPGQLRLRGASVVVVGAGGLGCPALQYLAASGVGMIGIIDHDVVEVTNLQRQVLHTESTVGLNKALSAAQFLKALNSGIKLEPITEGLNPSNAVSLLRNYDVILDCTDNAPTRYLISDTAVAVGKPLVSGAAQKYDGQLCVYNLGPDGPCYRCLFPKPPSPEMTGTCEETGILGAVTGVIGTMQALEAIKIITGQHEEKPSLLIFSALGVPPFRNIKLRSRRATCPACGDDAQKVGQIEQTDYVQFCGGHTPDWERMGMVDGAEGHRIGAKGFKALLDAGQDLRILDVRPRTEYGICQLPGSINVPLRDLVANPSTYTPPNTTTPTYIVCRLGNDSQIAAQAIRSLDAGFTVKDLVGGLRAWAKDVDASFPVY